MVWRNVCSHNKLLPSVTPKPSGDSADLTAAASRNYVPFTIGESTTGVLGGGAAGVPKQERSCWEARLERRPVASAAPAKAQPQLGALLAPHPRGAHPA